MLFRSDQAFVKSVERQQNTVIIHFEKISQQLYLTQDYFEALSMTTLKARIGEKNGLIEVIFDVSNKKDYEILEGLVNFGEKMLEIKQRKAE